MIELDAVEVVRPGPAAVLRARHAGEPVIAKVTAPAAPWTDSRSAFFGGAGLAPPFQPLAYHEADAWARVDPGRVVVAGEGPDGALWLVLRERPGRRLSAPHPDARGLLVGLLRALAALHARDVLHRDLRPENVIVDGEHVSLVDLDVARVAGLGPVGLVGSRAYRAPEAEVGEGEARADLFGAARLVRAACPDVPADVAAVLDALTAQAPGDRPGSAAEALAAVGVNGAPEASLSAPHAWARAHWATTWADARLALGDVWEVVRSADRGALEVPALAAVASRLLARAPAAGGERWLAVGAACWALHARTGDARYRAQADEARVYARAGWSPASAALDALVGGAATGGERTEALCALGLPALALEEAVAARHAGRVARAAWALGDRARADAALRASPPDPLAVRVAASRALLADPGLPPAEVLANALPEDALEAVRLRLAAGRLADADSLAAALPGRTGLRARLTAHLAADRRAECFAAARALAEDGAWDTTVAALVLADGAAPPERRAQAREILEGTLRAPDEHAARAAFAALGAQPAA
ncbi:MAG: protein kinase domain-containing protein, partial [Myxococcota bacterium]